MSQLPVNIIEKLSTAQRDAQDVTLAGSLWFNSTTDFLEYTLDGVTYENLIKSDGTGATGLWAIDISGNAASATTAFDVTGGYVASVAGTGDQVIVDNATGNVTFSLPQSIATTSSVTFGQVDAPQIGSVDVITLEDGGKIRLNPDALTSFTLGNDITDEGDNIRIDGSETGFLKDLFLEPGINMVFPSPYGNSIGLDGAPLGKLWVSTVNNIQPTGGVWTQTNAGLLITGTTEQEILGSGLGNLTFLANTFTQSSYAFVIAGSISSTNLDTLTVRVVSNFTTTPIILGTVAIPLDNSTAKSFEIEIDLTIRSIGAATTASIATNFDFTYNQNAGNGFVGQRAVSVNSTTFDTTISNTLTVTAQFSSASVTNALTSQLATLRKVF
jgi:hypothetical protein